MKNWIIEGVCFSSFLFLCFFSFHFEIVCEICLNVYFSASISISSFSCIVRWNSVSAFHSHSHASFFFVCRSFYELMLSSQFGRLLFLTVFFSVCIHLCYSLSFRFKKNVFMHIRSRCRLFVLKSWRRERTHSNGSRVKSTSKKYLFKFIEQELLFVSYIVLYTAHSHFNFESRTKHANNNERSAPQSSEHFISETVFFFLCVLFCSFLAHKSSQ